jgi:hypothetical protein
MRVYIAGPIAGRPDGNRSAFLNAAVMLGGLGHVAVNPHEVVPETHWGLCPDGPEAGEGGTHTAPCYMRADLKAMLTCEAIYLLRGWELSSGARTEFETARAAGLRLMYQGREDEVPPLAIDTAHLDRQIAWSRATFGPGHRTKGVIEHIRKELVEVEEDPFGDEWVDVIILAFDGAWRHGWSPQALIRAIRDKQARNEKRDWPDWRTSSEDHAIEHVKEGAV